MNMQIETSTFNRASVWPVELYEAARETCLRLYIANGGDANANWLVQPYPGTAAISLQDDGYRKTFTLCMPAFPMDIKLPRWKADLILAYTVHELLHALRTSFAVAEIAAKENLHSLVNSIEDCRIEAWGGRHLAAVANARGLLEALTVHIVERDTRKGYNLANPSSFAFTLNNILFTECVGYRVPAFPSNWRDLVPAAWVPVFEMAIREFPSLKSTADVLVLARKVKAAAANVPAQPNPPKIKGAGQGNGQPKKPGDKGEAQPEGETPEGAQAQGETQGDGDKPGQNAGTGASLDVSDNKQRYQEAGLDDLAPPVTSETIGAAQGLQIFLNAPTFQAGSRNHESDYQSSRNAIQTPAVIRRQLTLAVKSPERVGHERRQHSGRFDMREIVAARTGATDVFKRRVETMGQEAAITLLVDDSGSMSEGGRRRAAAAMALHMGDALRAANVKFEILSFHGALMAMKPFKARWDETSKRRVGSYGVQGGGGTAMMPALKGACARILAVPHVTRRIVLVLSDGLDGYPAASTVALRKVFGTRGVEIVGLGLMLSTNEKKVFKAAFGDQSVFVDQIRQLSETGLRALVKLLDKGAPRAD